MTTSERTQSSERDYYTVPEAARVLEVSPATVWRWIAAGRLEAYRVGPRRIRIRKQALESMVKPAQEEVLLERNGIRILRPSEAELARRREVIDRILSRRDERNIAPMTTTELIHKVREERERRYRR